MMSIIEELKKKRNDFIEAYDYQPNTLFLDSKTWVRLVSESGYSTNDPLMFNKEKGEYGRFAGMKVKLVGDKNKFISVALTMEEDQYDSTNFN
jgi:hypothetical protein